ncbi:MAG: 3-phenylpropionate/trans-cinnamate dioxygenase ferredoxin component [Chloroflexota bacterium]|jgi:3-phenylpropionate/trans-cinnamate dioxygenase ferredoxin subunit|nr:3-phenylpropionate/trans-cinnamate dioxygenase ferredoxin component [Chloroflexota bacterium]
MIRVASITEIPVGEARRFLVDGNEVAVVNAGSYLYAVDDICSHEHFHLSDGEVDLVSGTIECPKHGSGFDLQTGRPTSLPAVLPVRTYGVKLVGEDVMVDVLEPASDNVAPAGV